MLAASGFKTSVAEKAQSDATLTSAGDGLTVTASGKVTSGSVTAAGIITIAGSATSVGTTVTVVLTPSYKSDGKLIWDCKSSTTATFKYMPAECRHT